MKRGGASGNGSTASRRFAVASPASSLSMKCTSQGSRPIDDIAANHSCQSSR
jgi:hypothetical protein